ncbi:MAG: YihY/virulence factor BrkB family protein [Pseudomonadota bacterium]
MNLPHTPPRHADAQDVSASDLWAAALRVKDRIGEDRIVLISAGIAFFTLLALFPALTALVAVAGLILAPEDISGSATSLMNMLPEGAARIISDQINEVVSAQTESLSLSAVLALALAVYSASKGMQNLIQGLNIVYEEDEARGFFALNGTVLSLTFFVVAMLAVMMLIMVIVPGAIRWFGDAPVLEAAADIIRWPLLFVLAMMTLTVVYRFGPSRTAARWTWLAPGSLLACVLWVAGTAGFAVYVRYFGSYNETFGALGGVIILLTWFWLTALTALIGALIDAELEERVAPDTTVGPAKPRGQRGAVKADAVPAR